MQSKSSVHQSSAADDDSDTEIGRSYAHLDAEKLLLAFGRSGRYQVTIYIILQALTSLYSASMFVMPFMQKNPHMFCDVTNLTQTEYKLETGKDADQCYLYHESNADKYLHCGATGTGTILTMNETAPVKSMLKEHGFECSSAFWKEGGLSMFTIGALFTVPVMSYFADRFGRRPVLLITTYLSVIFNLATPWMPNYYLFLIARLFVGAMSDSYLTIVAIFSCEVVVEDGRDWMGLMHAVSWALGYLYVGLIAEFVSNWQWFYVMVVAPGLLTIPLYWIVPESPHWLIAHGKVEGIKEYIDKSEKFNNMKINLRDCQATKERISKSHRERRKSVWRVLKNKTIIALLVINGTISLVHQMYYFALSFTSVELSKNALLGYVLSGLIEIPAGIIVIPLMRFFGRKSLTVSSLILQGLFVVVCPYVDTDSLEWVKITFNLLGKLANGISNVTHPLLVSEMMPTMVRTLMFSFINVPQSIGIILAPFVKYLTFGYEPTPILILCVSSIFAGLLALTLPETKGKPMPEDLIHIDPGPVLWKIPPSNREKKSTTKSSIRDESEKDSATLLDELS